MLAHKTQRQRVEGVCVCFGCGGVRVRDMS